ncbi:RING-H2 finger protein ATL66-like [Canna indica]|uniref:RING-type E3 ubiquitin transferase n=1 Tax=Canna indica TaxID=4628 RepID=A0AAQ3Q8Y3_9LILI|nr:RING-H2 finger protein ATL66-like [Canna indica]
MVVMDGFDFPSARDCGSSSSSFSPPSPLAAPTPALPPTCVDPVAPEICWLFALLLVVFGMFYHHAVEAEAEEAQLEERGKNRAAGGLDPERVALFPVVPFDAEAWGDEEGVVGWECAVCLMEFGRGEAVRVLPGCGHGFHAGCVDQWLAEHATCPLCRRDLSVTLASEHVIDMPPEEY